MKITKLQLQTPEGAQIRIGNGPVTQATPSISP
ncbi:hypothetical protein RDI58_029028 [Solanum bulbocastanum]|uniref:Uncharacterized protein n=1 Tax=Solanum bulbocastanum TaxID=147425 RepID=A0AAN8SSY6_SOLBU